MLQRGGQHQRWPANGLGGHITPVAWGVPGSLRAVYNKKKIGSSRIALVHCVGRMGEAPKVMEAGGAEVTQPCASVGQRLMGPAIGV